MASRRESPDEGPSSERSESPFGPGEKMNYKSGASSKQKAAKSRAPSRKPSSPDADADERASAASAESDERRRVVPIPAEGPIVYVSYALADHNQIVSFVSALRAAGIRAHCDALPFNARHRPSSTKYVDAINVSQMVILYATPDYVERASPGLDTGVRKDIDMISEWVLLDASRHDRVFVVSAGTYSNTSTLIPLAHDFPVDKADPGSHAGQLVAPLLDRYPRPVAELSDLAHPRTELVESILSLAGRRVQRASPDIPTVSVDLLINTILDLYAQVGRQKNVVSWLYSRLNDHARSRVASRRKTIESITATSQRGSDSHDALEVMLYPGAASLLAWATLLSRKSTTAENLWGTHLLAAILHRRAPWTLEAETSLRELGLDPDELRNRLASEITDWQTGIPDEYLLLFNRDPSLQPLLLGDPLSTSSASASPPSNTWSTAEGTARLTADDPSAAANLDPANDRLGVDPDVIAFARVAASWDLTPPLAIGLFGNWGSGKTFFMKRMKSHIEQLSKDARNQPHRPQKDLEYCKYVVQIEFNAWHYSEGDLWACLVDHIFTNLRLFDDESDSEVARRLKSLLTEKDSLGKKREQSEERVAALKEEAEEAKKELDAAQASLIAAQAEYTAASVRDIWEIIRSDESLQKRVKGLLSEAGVNEKNIDSVAEIRKAIEDAQALGGRAKQVVRYLLNQRTNPWAYVAFAVTFGVPALVLYLASALDEPVKQAGAIVTATLSALAGGIPIYRTIAGHVSGVVDILDKPRRMAEEARRVELDTIQTRIQQLAEQRLEAEQHKQDIESQEKDLQDRIDAVNASRLLTEFLQDRAGTDDYRKRLGTLALIRRDFERLSKLMSEQRKEANEGKQTAAAAANQYQVNRIVLYIDDLDRCAPAKVVEVLQAIHLLLAFPLFVVVVGVDAGWVQRSIKQRYGELLRNKNQENGEGPQDEFHIDPRNYLEKIFQVPFWLPPLNINHCHNLMDGILKADVAAAADSPPKQSASQTDTLSGSNANDAAAGTNSAEPAHTATKGSAAGSPSPATDRSSGSGTPIQPQETPAQPGDTQTSTESDDDRDKDTTSVVAARSVAITSDEAERMKRFAPIVGTSPRCVKRFINCYRLFKAVVPGGHAAVPATTETNLSMFFLAVVVGAPDLFDIIHRSITYFNISTPTIAQVRDRINEQIKAADPRIDRTAIAQWEQVKPVLEVLKKEEAETKLHNITWIIDRARRFGYNTSMSPTPPTPTPDHEEPMDARARAAPPPA